jgi:hypothetical protein
MQRPRFNAVGGPTVPENRRRCALIPIEKVVDVVEADDADKNQIDGNDEVEQPRHDEDQDTGNERDQRREMGRGDDHVHEPFGWIILRGEWERATSGLGSTHNARQRACF